MIVYIYVGEPPPRSLKRGTLYVGEPPPRSLKRGTLYVGEPPPRSLKRGTLNMIERAEMLSLYLQRSNILKLKKSIEIVYVNHEYLKYLNIIDSQVHYEDTEEYKKKPHVGILIENNEFEYVIPLTSAKEKHKKWKNSNPGYIKIFEIVDIRDYSARDNDILADIVNQDLLKAIPNEEKQYYKQKILSVLDIRKMIPVKSSVYSLVPMEYDFNMSKEEKNRITLLMKEWSFLRNVQDKIVDKSSNIYDKQISKNKVLKYHCNYKKLEQACKQYK